MVARAMHRKEALMAAVVKLVSAGGSEAATVRAIAHEVGVTEGAVYRHFRSKEELCWQAYKRIVERMIAEKRALMASDLCFREKITEWIRLTYRTYDRDQEAFTYVLLASRFVPEAEQEITTVQGKLLMSMVKGAIAEEEARTMPLELALSHFTGLMLNIPRLINESTVQGPASQYVEEIANAVWQVIKK